MQARALWGMALATALSGCAEMSGGPVWPGRAWFAPPAPQGAQPPDTLASGRQAARSIWAVVPSAPRRKADLRPDLIQGSAVAVSADTLVANCLVVGGRARVGLVRHNKYRIARVTADAHGQVCRLTVAEGPLTPVAGLRSFADLRVGEPVVALASRTSAEVAAAPGWLAGKGSADDPFLEATPAVPAGNRSAVLVDGFGNLIGLGAAAPVAGGLVLAVPVGPAAAPSLANRDLGEADVLIAALAPAPRAQPRQAPILLALGNDDRDSADRTPATRRAEAATDEREAAPTPRASPVDGSASGGADGPGVTAAADRRVRQRPVAVASMAAVLAVAPAARLRARVPTPAAAKLPMPAQVPVRHRATGSTAPQEGRRAAWRPMMANTDVGGAAAIAAAAVGAAMTETMPTGARAAGATTVTAEGTGAAGTMAAAGATTGMTGTTTDRCGRSRPACNSCIAARTART